MFERNGQTISSQQAEEAAAFYGMSVENWSKAYGWKPVGKQRGSANQAPVAGPRVDGGSRSAPFLSESPSVKGAIDAEAAYDAQVLAQQNSSGNWWESPLGMQVSANFSASVQNFKNNLDAEGNYIPTPVNSFQGQHGEDENEYLAPGRASIAKVQREERNQEWQERDEERIAALGRQEEWINTRGTGIDQLQSYNISPYLYNKTVMFDVEDDYEEYGRVDYEPEKEDWEYDYEMRQKGITTEQDIMFSAQELNFEGDIKRMNLQFNEGDDVEILENWLGSSYYSKFAQFNIIPSDFVGYLKKEGYYDILNEEWEDLYDGLEEDDDDEKLVQAKEERLLNIIWEYLEDGAQAADYQYFYYNEYLQNPEKYNSMSGGLGGAYARYAKEQGQDMFTNVWNISESTGESFARTFAPTLTAQTEKNQRKWEEAYEARKAGEGFDNSYVGMGVNTVASVGVGAYEGAEDMVDWIGSWVPWTDNFYRRKRLRDRYSTSAMGYSSDISYAYVSGFGAEYLDGTTYIHDQDGGLYDITYGARVDMFMDPEKVQKIKDYIEENGEGMSDYSAYGMTEQGGRIAGDLVIQLLGTKGVGAARAAGSMRLMARANGFKNVKSFRKYLNHVKTKPGFTNVRNVNPATAETFGINLSKAPGLKIFQQAGAYDAMVYQSMMGAASGYNNTMAAAEEAGLSQEEAEGLAGIASAEMAALYGVTSFINPQFRLADDLVELTAQRSIVNRAIRNFKAEGGSVSAFRNTVRNSLMTTGERSYMFLKGGVQEGIQENIQQGGEIEFVNADINRRAGRALLKEEYTLKDITLTTSLSVATGGIMEGAGRTATGGFRMSPKQRFQNLLTISNDIEQTAKILDKAVERGRITVDEKVKIISQATAVRNNAHKIPTYMLNSQADLVAIAEEFEKINKLEAAKKGIDPAFHEDYDAQIAESRAKIAKIKEDAKAAMTQKEIEAVSKIAGAENIETFESTEAMRAAGIDPNKANSDGFMEADGKIYINLEVAGATGAISVASHEMLHKVLRVELVKNKENLPKVVNELRNLLGDEDLARLDERARLKNDDGTNVYDITINEDGTVTGNDIDEYITFLSDAMAKNELSFDPAQEAGWMKVGRTIINFIRTLGGNRDISFKSGRQVFNFIRDYQAGIQKGKLSTTAKAKAKASEKVANEYAEMQKDKASKTVLEEINGLVPESVQSQEQFFSREVFNPIYNDGKLHPSISNYIRSKATSPEEAQKIIDSVADRLINFNPAARRKSGDAKITLGEFIFSNVNFGKLDARKALFEESQERAKTESTDTEQARQITAQESAPSTQTEAPAYKNLLQRRVLDAEVISNIENKVKSTVRVMKTRMDQSVSKNVTVKPYIAEIKKAMGKQADIDLKKAMGGLKDGELRKFLLKNKAAILENMTTTYLMTAMPNAVQKKVDGQWTSNWKGKKIDRETVGTDNAGRTSGAELVRRLPKAATRLSDADFLSNFFTEDGKLIRGRKESLAKAMAEEISFDIFSKALQDPNSEIRKAFEQRQDLLGAELADNFVVQTVTDIERGNVKRSKTLREMTLGEVAAFNDGRKEVADRIQALNGEFGKNYRVLRDVLKDVYGDRFSKQVYEDLGKDLFNVLKSISKADVEAGLWSNDDFQDVIEDMGNDMDFIETVHKLTGASTTVAGLFRNPQKIADARENLVDVIKKSNLPVGVVKTFFSATFANSGRVGAFRKDGSVAENTRQDFFYGVDHVINELVGEGKVYTKEEWDSAETMKTGAKPLVSHLNGKFDSQKELRDADAKVADAAWEMTTAIMKGIKGLDADSQAMIMAAMNSGTNTVLRLAAPVTYVAHNTGNSDPKNFRYEHMTPARTVLALMYKHYVLGDKEIDIDALKSDYQVALIPKTNKNGLIDMDAVVGETGFGQRQAYGYQPGKTEFWRRYYNLFTRGKVPYAIRKLGTNELIGEKYAQMYNNVQTFNQEAYNAAVEEDRPSAKLSRSVPRAVFMVGGPGAGKTNVGKGLKLGRRGFKVVNQDLALEPMKEEAGLPANEQQYTREQRSMRARLGAAARKAADAKMAQYMNNKESMVVDGTGASYNATMKKINALREAGYEVSIVFANTSKEEAIARNKARAERALPDKIVEVTWDAVQESAKQYKQEFGDKFYELNTNDLKLGQDLPKAFLDKLYSDLETGPAKYSKNLDKEFNIILEQKTGVGREKRFSKVQAEIRGANKGRWKWFVAPGADDFRGLVHYAFAGKGKQGEAAMRFFEEKLMDPYFKGVEAINRVRQQIKRDYKATIKLFRPQYKMLGKKIGNSGFTYDQAVRVYLWEKQGTEVPGISKRDKKLLLDAIKKNPELIDFADALLVVARRDEWIEPGEYWQAQTVLSDLNGMTEKIGRKKFLEEFIENAEIIFSPDNMNKIEALYGKAHREALEDALYAMTNGTNRPSGSNATVNKFINWINGSTGAIMFFNRRSALLQMLSATNFINWSDNNPVKAAAAFANQKQYWSDWAKIFNSDKLKERRSGLKTDVSESELANIANRSKGDPRAILAWLLKQGFLPTQIADSFAIATGGATFYRNRVNKYLKEGMSKEQAEEQAWLDFTKISDEAQQSSDPALVSQLQRSVLGRLVFAFANTPMQYTRLMKKAALDLKNGRGDWKTNMSKIAYYGFVQNAIFSALQSALFALLPGFDDDDEELTDEEAERKAAKEESKISRVLNNMIDTIVRGSGVYGAVGVTVKNTVAEYFKQEEKGFLADHTYTLISATSISPPINSKLRKIYSAIQTKKFERDELEVRPWGVQQGGRPNLGPGWSITGSLVSGVFNVPLDRVVDELNSIGEAMDKRNTTWQRIALALGWKTWDVGARDEEADLIKAEGKARRKQEGIDKAKKTREENKAKKQAEYDALPQAKKDSLRYEEALEKQRKARERRMKK